MALTVLLRCADDDETRQFYESKLGFTVTTTLDRSLTVELHGGKLIFTCSDLWESTPRISGTFYFTVPDVDGYFQRVKDQATIAWPLNNTSYGSREFAVKDCNGYYLAFHQRAQGSR